MNLMILLATTLALGWLSTRPRGPGASPVRVRTGRTRQQRR
jgi:hypothetical protein